MGACQSGSSASPRAPPPMLLSKPAQKTTTGTSVAIIYYSMYGHATKMAKEIKAGVEAGGVAADLFQVPETLPQELLLKMNAPAKPVDIMTIDHAMVSKLPEYDGFIFGLPTRFGMMCGQMKTFFDSTGGLWQAGKLVGKPAATFVSTGTQNGGQETTHLTAVTQVVHHGMIYVPLGYTAGAEGQFDVKEVHGGSPYGASTLAGADGSRMPSSMELAIAKSQGKSFAGAVKRTVSAPLSRSCKVCIVYYSTYGHVKVLADEIAGSLRKAGVTADLYQAPELLSEDVLKAMSAPAKSKDPVMDHTMTKKLPEYDGFMFGLPTRFGDMASQMKAFFDGTGGLWQEGKLVGKLAATFVSTGTQNGGQETTHLTAVTQLVHHGMIYVPLGYSAGAEGQFDVSELHGGSPWGSSTIAGADGSRMPTPMELKIAAKQGELFAAKVKQMASSGDASVKNSGSDAKATPKPKNSGLDAKATPKPQKKSGKKS